MDRPRNLGWPGYCRVPALMSSKPHAMTLRIIKTLYCTGDSIFMILPQSLSSPRRFALTLALSVSLFGVTLTQTSLAAETSQDNCQLSGLYTASGIIHLPWERERKGVSVPSAIDCITEAQSLLTQYKTVVPRTYSLGFRDEAEVELNVQVTLKKVQYEYKGPEFVVRGEVEKAENN